MKQGTLVELAVKAIGNPLPDIVWLKNSDIITPHKHPHIKYVPLTFTMNPYLKFDMVCKKIDHHNPKY